MTSEKKLTKRNLLKTMLKENAKYLNTKKTLLIITDDDLVSRKYHYVIRIPDDVTSDQKIDKSMLQKFHFYNGKVLSFVRSLSLFLIFRLFIRSYVSLFYS